MHFQTWQWFEEALEHFFAPISAVCCIMKMADAVLLSICATWGMTICARMLWFCISWFPVSVPSSFFSCSNQLVPCWPLNLLSPWKNDQGKTCSCFHNIGHTLLPCSKEVLDNWLILKRMKNEEGLCHDDVVALTCSSGSVWCCSCSCSFLPNQSLTAQHTMHRSVHCWQHDAQQDPCFSVQVLFFATAHFHTQHDEKLKQQVISCAVFTAFDVSAKSVFCDGWLWHFKISSPTRWFSSFSASNNCFWSTSTLSSVTFCCFSASWTSCIKISFMDEIALVKSCKNLDVLIFYLDK